VLYYSLLSNKKHVKRFYLVTYLQTILITYYEQRWIVSGGGELAFNKPEITIWEISYGD